MSRLNLAIGPACFVQCRGCYNQFGLSRLRNSLISAAEITDFVRAAIDLGLEKITLSGGDPLAHPEFIAIVRTLSHLGVPCRIDTVGTAFTSAAPTIFYGHGEVPQVSPSVLAGRVELVSLPMDGSTPETAALFRRGRPALLAETAAAAHGLVAAGVPIGINTVVHRHNLADLPAILERIVGLGAGVWQLFEFQPSGPLGSRNRAEFELDAGVFDEIVGTLRSLPRPRWLTIIDKSRLAREDLYFMVDDSGIAWSPAPTGPVRVVHGHITRDREAVLAAFARQPVRRAG